MDYMLSNTVICKMIDSPTCIDISVCTLWWPWICHFFKFLMSLKIVHICLLGFAYQSIKLTALT